MKYLKAVLSTAIVLGALAAAPVAKARITKIVIDETVPFTERSLT